MELRDLNPDERIALVALIKTAALADHGVSPEEEDALADIIDDLGEDAYRGAFEVADSKFEDEDDLKTFLQTVKRQEARELIYGTILDLTMSDAVTGHESPLLRWLASTWNVEATIESSPDDGGDEPR
jgi:hypothetical protein